MRITILGNSGSGKSTLAGRLQELYQTETLDLDTVAWEPAPPPTLRSPEAAGADVQRFCESTERWIVEGCYANLARVSLEYEPLLLFLDPGLEACRSNCRGRPWEPHKYASKEDQDEKLSFLLSWVADYYEREGELSHRGHQALFDAYTGPRLHLRELPGPDLPDLSPPDLRGTPP